MASNDILKSKLSEVESLLTFLKNAVDKDVTNVNEKDKENVVTDGEAENATVPPPTEVAELDRNENGEPFKSLFYDKKEILSLKEALDLFEKEEKAITEMPTKPTAGEVILYRGKDEASKNDWRSNGHFITKRCLGNHTMGHQIRLQLLAQYVNSLSSQNDFLDNTSQVTIS